VRLCALLLAAALAAPARAAEREGSVPSIPAAPAGLGSAPSAPSLPSGAQLTASALPPALPASAIPQAAPSGAPAGPGASSALSAAQASAPQARAQAPEARGRAVAETASPLERAGVPREAAAALGEFAADPSLFPKGETPALHDAALARTLALLAAQQSAGEPARRRATLAAAALLATLDPSRAPGSLPRPGSAARFLSEDPRAKALLEKLASLPLDGEPPIDPAEVIALARLAEPSAEALRAPAPGWTAAWGPRLRFLRQAAPFLGQTVDAQKNFEKLAAEQRATASAALGRRVDAPTDAQVNGAAFTQLSRLRESPYFQSLPEETRSRFESTMVVMELFRTDAPKHAAQKEPPGPSGMIRLLGREPKTVRVDLERRPRRMDATFMVTDEAGRRLALKTARYSGVEIQGKDEKAALSKEAGYARDASAIASLPTFPDNVRVAKWLSFAELSPQLAKKIYGDAEIVPAMILERAPGRTLQQHLNSGGRLQPRSFAGLVEAYRRLHAAGFLHGDPNMGNILIEERGGRQYFTLLDFNASKKRDEVDAAAWRELTAEEDASVAGLAEFFR
jgi:hypothetical protein